MACRNCGKEIVGRTRRAIFCDYECKEAWHLAKARAASALRRTGRVCVRCSGPIPDGGSGKARTCSQACRVAWQNEKRQAVRRSVWLAVKQPCRHCGGEIADTARTGSLYCSQRCKKQALDARWRAKSPGYMRQYLYGVTPEQYAELLDQQGNRCAICRTDAPGGKGGWHVDHDHATGRVRGLLCHSCNIMLGHANDDPARLQSALEYLTR